MNDRFHSCTRNPSFIRRREKGGLMNLQTMR